MVNFGWTKPWTIYPICTVVEPLFLYSFLLFALRGLGGNSNDFKNRPNRLPTVGCTQNGPQKDTFGCTQL